METSGTTDDSDNTSENSRHTVQIVHTTGIVQIDSVSKGRLKYKFEFLGKIGEKNYIVFIMKK